MLIKNGRIHDGNGKVRRADILIEKGIIKKIGKNLKGSNVIDASGKEILPGFIDPVSHWGVNGNGTEIRSMGDDHDEQSDPITPELNAVYALNGRALSLQMLFAFGITSIGVAPSDNNLFGGQICVFETNGINPMKMVIKEKVAMKASVSNAVKKTYGGRKAAPMTDMRTFAMLAEQLRLAKEYDLSKEGTKRDEKMLALKQVVDGKMPLFVTCDNSTDMQHVLDITKPYKINLVFINTSGVSKDDTFLTKKNVAMIQTFGECDAEPVMVDTDYAGVYALAKKGAKISIASGIGWSGREDLLWNAMDMMKAAKEPELVLSMLTKNTADILGVGDVLGTIEEGKRADLVIWDKNPLETFQACVEKTFIAGKQVYKKGDALRCYL